MVKNTTGGSGSKSLARKHLNNNKPEYLRIPESELERFAYVSKMFGHGMCEVYLDSSTKLTGHIRNKFRGRQKRHNLITTGSIILVGLREWESTLKNCDILTIYDDNDIKQLKKRADIDIEEVLKVQISNSIMPTNDGDTIEFTTNTAEEEEEELQELDNKNKITFVMNETEEVDIDDI